MRVLLVLPDFAVTRRELRRCREALQLELGVATVDFAAAPEHMSWARMHEEPVQLYTPDRALADWDRAAFIEKAPGRSHALQGLCSVPVYRFDFSMPYGRARVLPVYSEDNQRNPQLSAHLFNRLAPDRTDILYFFPHGYLYRQLGVGPIDDFGHRIAQPLKDLAHRGADERVIAVFGGSAAWSPDCLHHEMFSSVLEEKLRAQARRNGSPLYFTVLNFGQHGNVVLNELQTFTMFCIGLRPDVVLAHDGYNDFAYGLTNDPNLLGKHCIAYQDILEQWSRILHKPWDPSALRTSEQAFRIRNTIESILRSYLIRKGEFERVATSLGCHFVWGLQPCLGSKSVLSPAERAYIEARQRDKKEVLRLFYSNVPRLYDAFTGRPEWTSLANRVDCHRAFATLSPDVDHFVDHVHCSPEGDEAIAGCYAEYLNPFFFNGAP